MTLDQWLDGRSLEPPPALRRRIDGALAAAPGAGPAPLPDVALGAALALLDGLLGRADSSRAGALELLAADALMTYAFEAAAEDPERLEELAARAMQDIAGAAADVSA